MRRRRADLDLDGFFAGKSRNRASTGRSADKNRENRAGGKAESGREKSCRQPRSSACRARAPAAPPPAPKPPEVKPIEPKLAEIKPPEAKLEPKVIEEKPAPEETVETKPVKPEPLNAEPAAADFEPPKVANAVALNPVLPSVPDLPREVNLNPLSAEKPDPLPVTAAKLVKQAAPLEIDVESRLDDVIPSLELKDVPFARALSIVSSISTLPITLDADAMQLQGVSPRDPVSVSLKNSTVEKLLDEIASCRGMAAEIDKGQILVTASAEQAETLRTIPYTIADLCENGTSAADLAELLQKFIAPDSWRPRGGQGSIKVEHGTLKIAQNGAVHREIVIFCEKLRLARGLSPRSKLDPSRFQLASAYAQAKPLLDKPVSANFHEPTTLAQILDNFGSRAGVEILIDRQALAAAGMSDKMEISYSVAKKPLETALDGLLRPLALGYRAIDSHTLQVATQKELERRLEWEIYPVGKLLRAGFTGRDLVAQTKLSVAPSSWTSHGQISYDPPAKALLVSQSPAVQAALSRYLAEKAPKK